MKSLSKRNVLEAVERAKATHARDYRDDLPTWCPGCGHFSPLQGLYEALERLEIKPQNFVLVSGIGCSGRFPFFIKGFGFHALHGRAIPIATGIHIANPELRVVIVGGDGDGIGIGGGHLPHAARYNLDITYLLLDNSIYGLTKGQVSPTSPLGMVSSTTPYGNIGRPLNPTSLAIVYGATYVARVFSGNRDETTDRITEAIAHRGFSIVHVMSPCVEFNKSVTYQGLHENVAPLPADYLPNQRARAIEMAESEKPVYVGSFYRESSPTYFDRAKSAASRLG